MSEVALIEATPWDVATGAARTVRLAGGGRRGYTHRDRTDWLAGVATTPLVTTSLGFDQTGFTGGAIPASAAIAFTPSVASRGDDVAALLWPGAEFTIRIDDDASAAPTWPIALAGTVAGYAVRDGTFAFTVSDLAGKLGQPLVTATFAGTGGLEGGDDATGRVKRRTWGRAWNVPGALLDKAYNIFEFGDPAFAWAAIDAVRDRGRGVAPVVVGWAGSAEATLAALRAAAAPTGGAAVAPSIACAKWWTQPAGPLVADVRGEVSAGYVETVPAIADRIAAAVGVAGVADLAAAVALRPDPAGVHVASASESAAAVLDRLLLRASLIWSRDPAGPIVLAPIAFDTPIARVRASSVEREAVYRPVTSIALTYRQNERVHADGEISAAVSAADVIVDDGRPVTAAIADAAATAEWAGVTGPGKPADNADVTGDNIAKDTMAVGGRPAPQLLVQLDRVEPIANELTQVDQALGSAVALLNGADANAAAAIRQAQRDRDRLAQTLLRLTSEAGRTRDVLRDAGIAVDPNTGTVRIYALDSQAERIGRAELLLDGVSATISQKASVDYVNERILAAQLDPSQIAGLDELVRRVSSAESAIDGLNAAVELRATLVELTQATGRITTAEQRIDAAEGAIVAKAEQTEVNRLGTRIGSAEQRLEAIGDTSGLYVTVRQARLAADATGEASLRALLAGEDANQRRLTQITEARQELYTRLIDGDAAEAAARTLLNVRIGDVDARLVSESYVRATETGALTRQANELGVSVGELSGTVTRLAEARVDGDAVNARAITDLSLRVNDPAIGLPAAMARLSVIEDAYVAADQANARAIQQLSAQVNDPANGLPATRGIVSTNAQASADRDSALGKRIDAVSAQVGGVEADVTALSKASADADEAAAIRITQVNARFGDLGGATVQQQFGATADRLGNVEARAGVSLDVNGRVTGWVANNDGRQGQFAIVADRFAIVDPDDANSVFAPFEVVNGQTYIRNAVIGEGRIAGENLALSSVQRTTFQSTTTTITIPRAS